MSVVETVHARRMKREGEVAEENKCSGLKEACEKDEGRRGWTMSAVERVHARMRGRRGGQMSAAERVHARMRGRRGRQMSAVERVHVRRMREEEGRTNVCSREGTCKKDEGGGGEDKCLR